MRDEQRGRITQRQRRLDRDHIAGHHVFDLHSLTSLTDAVIVAARMVPDIRTIRPDSAANY